MFFSAAALADAACAAHLCQDIWRSESGKSLAIFPAPARVQVSSLTLQVSVYIPAIHTRRCPRRCATPFVPRCPSVSLLQSTAPRSKWPTTSSTKAPWATRSSRSCTRPTLLGTGSRKSRTVCRTSRALARWWTSSAFCHSSRPYHHDSHHVMLIRQGMANRPWKSFTISPRGSHRIISNPSLN